MRRTTLIGVPSDRKQIGAHPFQAVGEKYLRAITDAGVGMPLMLPSTDPRLEDWLDLVDGIFLTGSVSNIEPHHYSDEPSYPGNLHDPQRDVATLPLVALALRKRIPLLAVCRGMQEVNVALGGTLWQKVHEAGPYQNHREDLDAPLDVQYGPAHVVRLSPGGWLAGIADTSEVWVNSLHGQGVRALAPGLRVEATAADGLIEAVSVPPEQGFLLAVQWHPEWKVRENSFYLGIFHAFARAVAERAAQRS